MSRSPYPVSPDDPILIEIMHNDTLVASSREYGGENWGTNNTMKVSFTVREAGSYRISILARGMPIRGSPFKKDFLPGNNTKVSAIVVVLKTDSFAKVSQSLLGYDKVVSDSRELNKRWHRQCHKSFVFCEMHLKAGSQ